jgi:hypothetical protein
MAVDLRSYFDRAIRASFADLALADEPAGAYLSDLLVRFVRTEALHPRGATVPGLETVVDMLLETQRVWQDDTPWFHPERELAVRRHIGDYTLFMTGLFRERVERAAGVRYFVDQGTRAYRFVSEHERARARPAAPPYRRLAERFESFAGALDYARRVYFRDRSLHPFFRLNFG